MLAVAYARWSSLEQGKGSTLERQLQVIERYCSKHGLEILERVTDEGSSAYTGTNIQTGHLGDVIRRVEAGRLPRDITIVVEQLDRIRVLIANLLERYNLGDRKLLIKPNTGRGTYRLGVWSTSLYDFLKRSRRAFVPFPRILERLDL